mmetsp:Transcript_10941/g.15205  ORF Transcript_10941/g.15205 Transcript_10941/m.15205 type:complete len:318 (+) Transcript_10941:54-1007(+)
MPERYVTSHPLLAGMLAGGCEICLTYPLEYAKVQCQLISRMPCKGTEPRNRKPVGFISVIRDTVRRAGPIGLYEGLTPWLVFSIPRAALKFTTYETLLSQSRKYLRNPGDDKKPTEDSKNQTSMAVSMICGALAGAAEMGLAGTPMQNLSIKMLHDGNSGQKRQFHGFSDAVVAIYRREGFWRGFYSGISPTVSKGMINSCIRFVTYEKVCGWISTIRREAETSTSTSLSAGFTAGLVSAIITQPIDTVKTNVQSLSASSRTRSALRCAKDIYQAYGISGFYRGIGARLLRVCSEQAILFTLFYRFGRILDHLAGAN